MRLILNMNMQYGLVKQKEYFDKIYQRFAFEDQQTQKRMSEIHKMTKKYLEER